MGAWGVSAFDDDAACDWAYELEESDDLAPVEAAIVAVLEVGTGDYLESDLGSRALAACEVIARLRGKWGVQNAHTEAIDNWVSSHPLTPSPDLVAHADRAIGRVLGNNSELPEVWEGNEEWLTVVEDLRRRVRG